MTNYNHTVDYTAFVFTIDRPKYPLVKTIGHTVNPVVIINTINRSAKDDFTNRLSTLSRPPPNGGFPFWARRSYPQVFGERRANELSTFIHNFLTEKTGSIHFDKMPKSLIDFLCKSTNRNYFLKSLDKSFDM